MHIAICMWGLLRSLPLTIDSFHRNILGPLQFSNHSYDLYLHTYKLSNRSTTNEWKQLSPQYIYIGAQDEVDERMHQYVAFMKHGDPWKNDFVSLKNHIRALNSLYHVTTVVERVIQSGSTQYDAMIFVRPDVKILTPLPMAIVSSIPVLLAHSSGHTGEKKRDRDSDFTRTVFASDFHRSCHSHKHEVNDRFSITTVEGGMIYGKRLLSALSYAQQWPLHSESFLGYTLTKIESEPETMREKVMKVIEIPFYFQRIRSNGEMNPRDRLLPRQYTALAHEKRTEEAGEEGHQWWISTLIREYYDSWYRWYKEVFCHPYPLHISYQELQSISEPARSEVEEALHRRGRGRRVVSVSTPMNGIQCSSYQTITLSTNHHTATNSTEMDDDKVIIRVLSPEHCTIVSSTMNSRSDVQREFTSATDYHPSLVPAPAVGGVVVPAAVSPIVIELPPWLTNSLNRVKSSQMMKKNMKKKRMKKTKKQSLLRGTGHHHCDHNKEITQS